MFAAVMTAAAHPDNDLAGQKLASGVFAAAPAPRAPKVAAQSVGTNLEGTTYVFNFTPGCAVAPNNSLGTFSVNATGTGTGTTMVYQSNAGTSLINVSDSSLASANFISSGSSTGSAAPSSQNSDWAAIFNAGRETFGNDVFQKPLTTLGEAAKQQVIIAGTGVVAAEAWPVVAAAGAKLLKDIRLQGPSKGLLYGNGRVAGILYRNQTLLRVDFHPYKDVNGGQAYLHLNSDIFPSLNHMPVQYVSPKGPNGTP